jgi:DNA invertase Pin-like site-specific DNA recombinase
MINVFAYLRVSGKSQVEGDGPERQRDTIRRFCSDRKAELVGEKFEAGVSGTKECLDRPAFVELLSEIECRRLNGQDIEGIVVERMDRLARDLIVQELLLKECTKRSIKVFAADNGELVDIASGEMDPTRKLIRQVLGAVAEYAKSELVLKLTKAKIRIKATGRRCDGAKPLGHYPGESAVIEFLKSTAHLGLTWRGKIRMLNDAGLRTRKNKPWSRESIRSASRKILGTGKVN